MLKLLRKKIILDENSFIWRRIYDVNEPTKLVQVIKALRIKGSPSGQDAKMFATKEDTDKFMLFIQNKEFMIGTKVPDANEYDFLMYRVFDVDTENKTMRSVWWEKAEGENVDFERVVVYPGVVTNES